MHGAFLFRNNMLDTMATSCAVKLLPLPRIRRASHQRFIWCTARRTGRPIDTVQLSSSRRQPTDFLTRHHFSSLDVSTSTYSNLGLAETLVHPHYESIRELPEIDNALHKWDDISALDDLQRATQIFEMMQAGGSHHIAAIAALAECYQHQGNYEKASNALHTLEKLVPESSDTLFRIGLARAKASWYQGDFDRSMTCVKQSMEIDAEDDSNLSKGCVLNAEGIVRLMNSPCRAEDGSSVTYVLKIASKITERNSRSSARAALTSASAKGNLGIAIVVTRLGLQETTVLPGTLDEGLSAFRDGINLLEQMEASAPALPPQLRATSDFIRAQLYCNMAWTLLQKEDELKLASEYSSTALSIVEKLQGKLSQRDYCHGLGRSLRLVASCYAQADSALTAEGLFQSAIDSLKKTSKNPLSRLDLRDTHEGYAKLLHQWDKRSRDAENQEKHSDNVNASLSEGWRGKSSICSGLDFITPGGFALEHF